MAEKRQIKKRKLHIIAAKVNIHENIFGYNVPELISMIPEAIIKACSDETCKIKNGIWQWTMVLERQESSYILGRLCKSRDETTEVINNTSPKTIDDFKIPSKVHYSYFYYEPETEILIFEVNSEISKKQFIENFDLLLQYAQIEIGKVIIVPYPKNGEYQHLLKNASKVLSIEFDLIPPNFKKKNSYKSIRQIIIDQKSKKFYAKFESEDGVNIEGDFIDESFSMLDHGYVPESRATIINSSGVEERISSKRKSEQRDYKLSNGSLEEVVSYFRRFLNELETREVNNDRHT